LETFNELTANQKKSVINLLLTIGYSDGEEGNLDKELEFMNSFIKKIGAHYQNSVTYYEQNGNDKMISDLKEISQIQKELLIGVAFDLITCDGKPKEVELQVASALFKQIGIREEKFFEILNTAILLIKKLRE
jgi:hypothetical protein